MYEKHNIPIFSSWITIHPISMRKYSFALCIIRDTPHIWTRNRDEASMFQPHLSTLSRFADRYHVDEAYRVSAYTFQHSRESLSVNAAGLASTCPYGRLRLWPSHFQSSELFGCIRLIKHHSLTFRCWRCRSALVACVRTRCLSLMRSW